jgi:hypothetical protein
MGNPRFTPPFSQQQLRTLVILPKIASLPSLVACPLVVHHVLRSKDRRATVYHRIILTMSVHDWLVAALNFVGTWMNPAAQKEYTWLAAGNQQTCTASGFLRQGSLLTSVLYSACLTLFFLLVVKYGWRERRISQFVEPAMHACCLMLGWGTAIAGLLMNLYAAYPWGCGIVADPPGCTQSYKATPENPANCVRGDNAGIYSWVFLTGWSWATFFFLFVAMIIIYRSVRTRETKNDQYDFGRRIGAQSDAKGQSATCIERSKKARTRSREFADQAFLYCLFFFVTFTFGSINISLVNWGPEKPYMPLMMLQTLFGPLQGFFNALVYARPRYMAYRHRHPERSCWTILWQDFIGVSCLRHSDAAPTAVAVSTSAGESAPELSPEGPPLSNDESSNDALKQEGYLE